MGRDSAVGIATGYGLEGLVIESPWGRNFPNSSTRALGPPGLLYNGNRASFPGGEAAGVWRWPPTPSSAEVKERVELYFFFPSGLSWPFLGRPLFYLYLYLDMYIILHRKLCSCKQQLMGIWRKSDAIFCDAGLESLDFIGAANFLYQLVTIHLTGNRLPCSFMLYSKRIHGNRHDIGYRHVHLGLKQVNNFSGSF